MNCYQCGTENEENASQCRSCAAPFQNASYVASVEKGLLRLEREKLSFLGLEPVISKFEAGNIERYQTQNIDQVVDIEFKDELQTMAEVEDGLHTLADVQELEVRQAHDPTHLGMRAVDDEVDDTFDELHLDGLDDLDSESVQDLDVDEAILESSQWSESALEEKRLSTLAYPLPEHEERTVLVDTLSQSGLDAGDLLNTSSQNAPEPRGLSARTENDAVQDIDGIVEVSNTMVPGFVDLLPDLEEVGLSSDASVPSMQMARSHKRTPIKSRLLRRDVHAPRERARRAQGTQGGMEAMDELERQGAFKTPTVHAEVRRNIDDIFELDKLLPQASLVTYHGEKRPEGLAKLNSSIPGLERASIRDASFEQSVVENQEAHVKARITLRPKAAGQTGKQRSIGARTMTTEPLHKKRKGVKVEQGVAKNVDQIKQEQKVKVKAASKRSMGRRVRRFLLRNQQFIWFSLIAILLSGIFFLFYLMGFFAWVSPELDPMRPSIEGSDRLDLDVLPVEDGPKAPSLHALRNAIDSAAIQVLMASDFDAYLASQMYRKALLLKPSNRPKAVEILKRLHDIYPQNREAFEELINLLIEDKAFDDARLLLLHCPENYRYDPKIKRLRYRAFSEDPFFLSPVKSIEDADYDEIGPLGGGSTLTFKIVEAGKETGAFKPLQTRRQSNYRAEIASWRLCELLDCRFLIPYNREVRYERTLFNKLFNQSRSSKLAAYRTELIDLIWTSEDGKSYVYGTLKDWVPNFTRFPIEFIDLWRSWVRQENFIETFPSLKEALSPLETRPHTRKLYGKLLEQSNDMETSDLANQIVQVLMFDFLTGNWDRFSGVLDWWGVNCQFKDGKIVSIDNGAAFQPYTNSKVTERFEIAERFSRRFIENLRVLDREMALDFLFPEASKQEVKSFERFWTQRAALLARVDSLIESYGHQRVLSFP